MPLLSTFLKSYARPYLGIVPPPSTKQIPSSSEPGTLSSTAPPSEPDGSFPPLMKEADESVEKDTRDRFKRMFESYFDNVCKKLVKEHKVSFGLIYTQFPILLVMASTCKNKIVEIMRRIFAQARFSKTDNRHTRRWLKDTRNYWAVARRASFLGSPSIDLLWHLLRLSELLYLPLPSLPTASQKSDSIQIGINTSAHSGEEVEDSLIVSGGKWEDEEERKFYEDIQDLKDFVPRSVLGIEETDEEKNKVDEEEKEKLEKEKAEDEVRKLEEELEGLKVAGDHVSIELTPVNGDAVKAEHPGDEKDEDEWAS
jgi:regulator of nonsense transcripts 2